MSGVTRIEIPELESTTTSRYVTGTRKVHEGSNKMALDVHVIDSITHVNQKVQESRVWSVSNIFSSVLTGNSANVLFVPTADSNMTMMYSGGGDFTAFMYEDCTVSSNGTTLTAQNNNRSAPTTTAATWFHTPTVTTVGSMIFSGFVPGGSAGNSPGGRDSLTDWIYKSGTKYLFRITNQAVGTETFSMGFSYYQ